MDAKQVERPGYSRAASLGAWRVPLLTGLALAVVTAIPYLYAYAVQPHDQVFMGFFYLGDDANTYLEWAPTASAVG